jgi:hypothetical protein
MKASLRISSEATQDAVQEFAAETLASLMVAAKKSQDGSSTSPTVASARWKNIAQQVQASALKVMASEGEVAVRGTAEGEVEGYPSSHLDFLDLDCAASGDTATADTGDQHFGNLHTVVALARRMSISTSTVSQFLPVADDGGPASRASTPDPDSARATPDRKASPFERCLSRLSSSSTDLPSPEMKALSDVVSSVMGLENSENGAYLPTSLFPHLSYLLSRALAPRLAFPYSMKRSKHFRQARRVSFSPCLHRN